MDKRLEFIKEFRALLSKYNVTFTAVDHWSGYSECGSDVRMTVEFSSDDWQVEDIDLGRWVDSDSLQDR